MPTFQLPLLLIGNKMKHSLAIAGGIAAVALAGCTVSAPPAPTVTVTQAPAPEVVTPTPAPEPTYSKEEVFVKVLEKKYGSLTYNQEQKLINFVKDTCQNFDRYGVRATLNEYAASMSSARNARVLGYVVGAGVAMWCPEYSHVFDSGTSA